MIKTNLAVLMAERGLKISDVYEATGISKTTLMAISENTGKGIQYDTIDKLCNYLGITPSDFFVYFPYSISFNTVTKYDESVGGFYINCIFKKESWENSEILQFSINNINLINELLGYDKELDEYDFSLYIDCSYLKGFFEKMPVQFRRSVELEIIENVFKAINSTDIHTLGTINSFDKSTADFIDGLKSMKDSKCNAFIVLNFEDDSTIFMKTKVNIKNHNLLMK